jgi:hypothetical protein
MGPCIQKIMWLSALIALMTVSIETVYAQRQDKEKPAAKPGDGEIKQGGMDQMGGRAGMT